MKFRSSSIKQSNAYTTIKYNSFQFHNIWLRDNCDKHKNPSGQKNVFVHNLDLNAFDIVGAKVKEDDKLLEIEWDDGHVSEFSEDFLKRYSYDHVERDYVRDLTYWDSEDVGLLEAVRFDDVMNDEKVFYDVCRKMEKYGLVIVNKAGVEAGTVKKMAEKFGCINNTMYGELFDVKSVEKSINIAYTTENLMLHQDLCYYESPPGLQLLHCRLFQAEGGISTYVDGFKVVEDFKATNPMAYKMLTEQPLTYHKIGEDHHLRNKRPLFELDEAGNLVSINHSPPFEGPLDIPFDTVQAFYKAHRAWHKFSALPEYKLKYRMEEGDIIIFNNRRIFHARTAYNGARHLEGTYVSTTDYSNTIRHMKEKYGDLKPTDFPSLSPLGNRANHK